MGIPNMCLVLKSDNGKVVSIANRQTESQNQGITEPSSTVLLYRLHLASCKYIREMQLCNHLCTRFEIFGDQFRDYIFFLHQFHSMFDAGLPAALGKLDFNLLSNFLEYDRAFVVTVFLSILN